MPQGGFSFVSRKTFHGSPSRSSHRSGTRRVWCRQLLFGWRNMKGTKQHDTTNCTFEIPAPSHQHAQICRLSAIDRRTGGNYACRRLSVAAAGCRRWAISAKSSGYSQVDRVLRTVAGPTRPPPFRVLAMSMPHYFSLDLKQTCLMSRARFWGCLADS